MQREKKHLTGMYEKAVPEEYSIGAMLHIAAETGYDFFEISIDRTEERIGRLYDRDFGVNVSREAKAAGIPIGSMCLSALGTYTLGHSDPAIEKKAVDIFFHAVDFAEEHGLRIVQIPACDVPKNAAHTEDTHRRFKENLQRLTEYASARAVLIGLENMEDDYMDNVRKCMKLIRAVDSPYFRLYPDAGNITSASKLYGTDVREDMLSGGADQYCALHLKETRPGKYGGLFYGDGHVDFQRIIKIAWTDLKIRRFVLEYWYTGNPQWKNDLILAREKCEEWIRIAEMERKSP